MSLTSVKNSTGGTTDRLLLIAGFALFCIGMILTFGWIVLVWTIGPRLSTVEFPFGEHLCVAVDSLQRIYVGDGLYERIQRYSSTGRFERGWFLNIDGIFVLRTTNNNRIEIGPARRGGLLIYSSDGKLLNDVRDVNMYAEIASKPEAMGPYVIKGILLPKVVDRHTGRTVAAIPWEKQLLGPFPSTAYTGLGVLLIAVGEWLRRRGRPGSPATTMKRGDAASYP